MFLIAYFPKKKLVEENLDQTTADDDEEKYVNVQDEVTDQNEKKMFNLNITIQLDESSNQDDDVMNQVDANQTGEYIAPFYIFINN